MKYSGIIKNDVAAGEDICVSLYLQGCPHKCPGCHNPETWSEKGGIEIKEEELTKQVLQAISANGVKRNFSILGGEPMAPYNIEYTLKISSLVREKYPDIKIYIWTGYTIEDFNKKQREVLKSIDYLIDGRYKEEERDLTLYLRGSRNQRILKKDINF